MLSGVMLLWFVLTGLSVLFVAIDIVRTPESPVLKWGFILFTLYTGPIGAFLYVLGCREPLPGLHEQYVATRWRQVLGSTIHCVAGDGLGILAGAVIGGVTHLSMLQEVVLEYVLGFAFGWTIFQSLFMKESAGGSFLKALKKTFIPELLSMNFMMAGMVPVMVAGMRAVPESMNPANPAFWFVMSMVLLVGSVVAYPVNWWLVSRGLKHGMMTVRPPQSALPGERADRHGKTPVGQPRPMPEDKGDHMAHHSADTRQVSRISIAAMTILSFVLLLLSVYFTFKN